MEPAHFANTLPFPDGEALGKLTNLGGPDLLMCRMGTIVVTYA